MTKPTKTTYYDNGQIETEKTYKDNNGKYKFWYKNGHKGAEGNYINGRMDGVYRMDGKWVDWYESGQIKSETHYKDCVFEKTTTWYENGQKEEEYTFLEKKTWYENGNLKKEENYKRVLWLNKHWTSIKHGEYTEWYENGNLKLKINYTNENVSDMEYKTDKKVGWYENGQKKFESNYTVGESWIHQYWDKDGNLS